MEKPTQAQQELHGLKFCASFSQTRGLTCLDHKFSALAELL